MTAPVVADDVGGEPDVGLPAPGSDDPRRDGWERTPWLLVLSLTAIVAVPLVVALVAVWRPQWFPIMDLAVVEMEVRDVGTRHTPLTGIYGRLAVDDATAHHPGPLGFYLLWPTYWLLGSSAFGLLVGSAITQVLGAATLLWIAARRGGIALVLGVSVLVVVLAHAYGANVLLEPWTPHLPVLWWVVFVFAVWSVVCGDLPLLPVAAAAASFCLQNHAGYLPLVGALGLLALGSACVTTFRHDGGRSRRAGAAWIGIAAATTVVLWLPPVIEELGGGTGNLSLLWQHFTDRDHSPLGTGRGFELLLLHLDPARLLFGDIFGTRGSEAAGAEPDGSIVPGLVLLLTWCVAALGSRWLGDRRLTALHAVVAVTTVTAWFAMTRIFGFVWYWVVLWGWGIAATMLLATAWTAVLALSRSRLGAWHRHRRLVAALAAAALLVVTARSVADFASVEVVTQPSAVVGELLPSTVEALDRGTAPGGGREGRYLVLWNDPVNLGVHGYSLVNELERRGFDVGAEETWAPHVDDHRVIAPDDATALVYLAGGSAIETVRARPGAEQVAYADVRSAADRAEFERVRDELIGGLRATGHEDLVPMVDAGIWAILQNTDVEPRVVELAKRMVDISVPYAVIVVPAEGRAEPS
jgi:hypothetical protein